MKWKIEIPVTSTPKIFINRFLKNFDISELLYIRISRGDYKTCYGLYGYCRYPVIKKHRDFKSEEKYRISGMVPGPFPCRITKKITKEPKPKQIRVNDIEEAFIFIVGHELFHFLRNSRQIGGVNYEWQADRFAVRLLYAYRVGEPFEFKKMFPFCV